MVIVVRGSTPNVLVHVNADLSGRRVRVVMDAPSARVERDESTADVTAMEDGSSIVTITLTREETMAWRAGEVVRLQVGHAGDDGRVTLSPVVSAFEVGEVIGDGRV